MGVDLVGVLLHSLISSLCIFKMTDKQSTGVNHIVEVIHRVINDTSSWGDLRSTLFLYLYNCTRDNKNKQLMAYLQFMVDLRLYDKIEVGLLPVDHTHTGIDYAFSTTYKRLHTRAAVPLKDLQHELSQRYNKKTFVASMKNCINWLKMCDDSGCIHKISNIMSYRFFQFLRKKEDSKENTSVCCMARETLKDG